MNLGVQPPMEIVQGAHGTQLGLLTAKRVDIALDLEPAVSIAESAGHRVVLDLARLTKPSAITGLMTTQRLIDQDPKLIQGMVSALQRAMDLLSEDKVRVAQISRAIFPDISAPIIEKAIDRLYSSSAYPKRVVIPEGHWRNAQAVRLERGDLKRIQPLEVAVDNRFALRGE